MTDLISIGKIRKSHGLDGRLMATVVLESPETLTDCQTIYLGTPGKSPEPYAVLEVRPVHNGVILTLESVTCKSDADGLINRELYLPETELDSLDEWTFYRYQLIGLIVKTVDGQSVGTVIDVLETGANDVYRVQRPDGKEVMIPALRSVIVSIDLDAGEILIDPMENMLD